MVIPDAGPDRLSRQAARQAFQRRLVGIEPHFLPLLIWVVVPVLLLPVTVSGHSSIRLLLPVILTGLILQSQKALPKLSSGRLARIFFALQRGLGFGSVASLWILTLLERSGPHLILRFTTLVLVGLFALVASIKLVFVLAQVPRVNARVLAGAAAGYIYLGFTGGLIAAAMQVILPGTFSMGESGGHELLIDRLTYFSFVVLAGLGLGDVLPHSALGERFVILLSLSGTLYQAVLVGLLIGRFIATQEADLELEALADASAELPPERSAGTGD